MVQNGPVRTRMSPVKSRYAIYSYSWRGSISRYHNMGKTSKNDMALNLLDHPCVAVLYMTVWIWFQKGGAGTEGRP